MKFSKRFWLLIFLTHLLTYSLTHLLHSAPWWEVYFTAGDGVIGSASALEQKIGNFMSTTSSMCYVANYSWSDTATNEVVLKINSLYTSGTVDVKVVGDNAQGTAVNEPIHPNITSTIPMNDRTTAGSSEYMHDKVIIRDPNNAANAALMMGSGNYNEGGWESQNNTFLFLYNQALTLNYLAEFNEMFKGTFAGGTKTTRVYAMPNGTEVRSFFGSEDQPWAATATTANGLISLLNASTESIFFEITDLYGYSGIQNPMEASCVNRAAAGVIAEGVYQSIDTASSYDLTDWNAAANANANNTGPFIRESAVTAFTKHHHKYFVIDMDWAGVGSVNASQSSAETNPGSDENFILINDFRLAREFMKEFGRNYALTTPVGAADNAGVTEIHNWVSSNVPTGLSVTPAALSFAVSWTFSAAPSDFSRYYIFISTNNTIATAKEQTTDAQGGHKNAILRPEMQKKGRTTTSATLTTYNEGDTLVTATSYYIGVVSVDKFGNESAALTGGPYQLSGAPNNPPNNPASLQQYKSDGITVIAVGAQTTETTVVLKGTVSDPDVNNVKLQVEVRATGTAFSNVSTHESGLVASGGTASVTVSGLTSGTTYHWQARAVDSAAAASSWVVFNGADSNHFVVQTAATSNGTILPNAKGGTDTTTENLTEIQTDNASGASPTSMAAGDGWYTVEGNIMFLDGFDITGLNGTITALTLKVQYSVETGYGGTNSVKWALNGGVLANTTITPVNGQVDLVANYNLLAQGVDTFAKISTLDIEFTNTDGNDGIAFDYLWLEVTYTPAANNPPTAPTGGTTTPDGSVNWTNNPVPAFSWTFNDPDAGNTQSAFQLTTSGGYDTGKTVSATSSHTPGSALADGTWTWNVKTWDQGDLVSPVSVNWTVKIDANLSAPTSLDAGYNGTSSTLTWTAPGNLAPSGLDTYNVYRATYSAFTVGGPNVTKLNAADVTVTNYDDSTVSPNITYYYGITAVDNAVNTSALSNIKSVYTGSAPAVNLLPSTTGQWHFGFEPGGATVDTQLCWQEPGAGSTSVDNLGFASSHEGARVCRFDNLTAAYGARTIISATCTVTAGNNYSVGIWGYVPALAGAITDVKFRIGIRWYDASNNFLSEVSTSDITMSAYDTWQKQTYTNVIAPAGATGGRLLVDAYESNALDYDPYLDDAEFISVTPAGDTSAPTNVGLLTPLNNAVNVSTTATLTANTATDVTLPISYWIQIALDAGFTTGLKETGWQTSTSTSPVLANSITYYWRVKAKDNLGNTTTYKGHILDVNGYGTFVTAAGAVNQPPSTPSALGPADVVSGIWIINKKPTFDFTLDDPENDTVKYRIQIDDTADFSSPVVDYTSALAAEGAATFTVGQAVGGGSYTVGLEGQSLSDSAGYYWRVMATDSNNNNSGWTTANGGAIAFKLDTSQPIAINDLSATQNGSVVDLLWSASDATISGVKNYRIYRSSIVAITDANRSAYFLVNDDASVGYTDSSVEIGKTYYYAVTTVDNASNESSVSNSAQITVTGTDITGITINEVFPAPANDDTDEFVELYNKGGTAVDISGWFLSDPGDTNDPIVDYTGTYNLGQTGTTLQPGWFALVVDPGYTGIYNTCISAHADTSKMIMVTESQDATLGNGLGNTSDTIWISSNATGMVLSSFTWLNSTANKSWEKIYSTGTIIDRSNSGNWVLSTHVHISTYCTPGFKNSVTPSGEISLFNQSVTPSTGIATVTFKYQVHYSNPNNLAPTTKDIVIDGTSHNMTYISGSYLTDALFEYNTTLSTGLHNYYFYFAQDAQVIRLPANDPDVFNGPAVGPELQYMTAYSSPTTNPPDNTDVDLLPTRSLWAFLKPASNTPLGQSNWSGYTATIYWSTSTVISTNPSLWTFTKSRTMTFGVSDTSYNWDKFYVNLSSGVDYFAGNYINYYVVANDAAGNQIIDDQGDANSDNWVALGENAAIDNCHYFKVKTSQPSSGIYDRKIAVKTEPIITSDAEGFYNDFNWTGAMILGDAVDDDYPNNLVYNNDNVGLQISVSPGGIAATCTFYYTTNGSLPTLATPNSFSGGASQLPNDNWYKNDGSGLADLHGFFPSDLNAAGCTIQILAAVYDGDPTNNGTSGEPYQQLFKYYVLKEPGTPAGDNDTAIVFGRGNRDGRYPTTDFDNYSPLRHLQNDVIRTGAIEKYLYPNNPLLLGTTDEFIINASSLTATGHDGITDIFYSDQVQFYLRTSYKDIDDIDGTLTPNENEAYIVWLASTTDWSTAPFARLRYNSSGNDNQPPHLLKYHWLIGENTGLEGYSPSNPSDCTKGAPEGATVQYIFKVRDNQSAGAFRWIYRDPTTNKQRITDTASTAQATGNQFTYRVLQDDYTRPVAYMPENIPGVVSVTHTAPFGVVPATYTAPSWPTASLGSIATTCGSTVETVKVYIGLFDTADGRFTTAIFGSTAYIDNPNYVHRTFKDPAPAPFNNADYFGNNVLAINTTNYTRNSGIKGGRTDNSDSYAEGLEGYNSEGKRVTHDVLLYYAWQNRATWIDADGSYDTTYGTVDPGPGDDDSNHSQYIRIENVDGATDSNYVTQQSSAAVDGHIAGRVSMAPYNVESDGNGIWVAEIPAPSDSDIMVSTCVYLYYRIWASNGDNDPQAYYLETHGGLDTTGASPYTFAGSHGNSIDRGDLIENPYGKTFIDTSDDANHPCGRVHDRDYGWVDITRYGGRITSPPRVMIKSKVTVGGVTRTITTYLKVDPTTRRPTNIISTQVGAE